MLFGFVVHTHALGLKLSYLQLSGYYHVDDQNYGRDLSSHLPFGSYAEQGMHTKAPSRFLIVAVIIIIIIAVDIMYTI